MECCQISVDIAVDLLAYLTSWVVPLSPVVAIGISTWAVLRSNKNVKEAHELDLERESRQVKAGKIETLYLASITYRKMAEILNEQIYKTARYDADASDVSLVDRKKMLDDWLKALDKMEMILGLYFPNEGFDVDTFKSDLLLNDASDSDENSTLNKSEEDIIWRYEMAQDYIEQTDEMLKSLCFDLMKRYT